MEKKEKSKCKKCKYCSEDGWIERYVCIHPKFPLSKVIIDIKEEGYPFWCPLKKH